MAKSLIMMVMLVSVALFLMASPIFSQKIDVNSEKVPEDVTMSPSDFDIHVESPIESPYEHSVAVTYDKELIHHYSKKQINILHDCLRKPISECGEKIYKTLLDEKTAELTDECCRDLLKFGKDCHVGLARLIFSTYEYKNKATTAIPKSKQMWNSCAYRVGNQIGVSVSLEN